MGRLISLIYFYLVSIIGLILLIIGIYNIVTFTVNSIQYDKYPLRYAGNEECGYYSREAIPAKPIEGNSIAPTLSPEEVENQRKACEVRVERERKQQKVDDMKNSIYFTLTGVILLAIHLPIALRKSSEKEK